MRTPNAVIGFVIGAVLGWAGVAIASYAGTQLYTRRMARFTDLQADSLPWLLAMVAIPALLGVLMSLRSIGSAAMTGAGALLTVAGIAFQVLPIRSAVDLMRLFELPGNQGRGSVLLLDGAMVFIGVILLIVGGRRWATDAKSIQRAQDITGYYPPHGGGPGYPTAPPSGPPGYPTAPPSGPPAGTFPG